MLTHWCYRPPVARQTPSEPRGTTRSRAEALPPDERRARIVAAAEPLLLAHGTAATIRQIADAAGIAEGTIFGVFPDKDALVDSVVESVTDVSSLVEALGRIDRAAPLEDRLIEAVELLRRRVSAVFAMASALGPRFSTGRPGLHDDRVTARVVALAEVFEPDADLIRLDPMRAARALHGLTIASTHPLLVGDEPAPSPEIVSLLLDGLRTPQEPPC